MLISVEREVKLAAPSTFEPPVMRGAVPGVIEGDPRRLELDATYYDTADLALVRAGITVRYRAGEPGPPWTVKLPARSNEKTLSRLEARFVGAPEVVPADARDLVRAYVRSQPLRAVARLHTERTSVPLIDSEGHHVAELVDDLVTGYLGDETETRVFREIEFEVTAAHHRRRLQRATIERLASAGCRAEAARSKLARVLGARAELPPDVSVADLKGDPTVLEALRHAFGTSLDRLIRHDAGVRIGDDPEEVHQLRVAARTLRSNLKTFRPVLDPDWARSVRASLAWLGTTAGPLRDLHVLENRLLSPIGKVDDDDADGLNVLFRRLAQQQDHARDATLAAMRSPRYDRLLDLLVRGSHSPSLAPSAHANALARPFLRDVARHQVTRLDALVACVASPPSDEELHRVRIQAKRTRYAIEAARTVIGTPTAEHARAIALLQDVLGEFHDSTVMVTWLRDAASDCPTCGLAAGQILAAERVEQHRLRSQMHPVWQSANRAHLKRWLRSQPGADQVSR